MFFHYNGSSAFIVNRPDKHRTRRASERCYLSIDRLLKAPPHVSVLPGVWPAVSVVVPVGVGAPAAVIAGRLVCVSRLGALLDRVHALSGGQPLARLDASYLVDFDHGLWRVLYVDVDQGRVVRHCGGTEM